MNATDVLVASLVVYVILILVLGFSLVLGIDYKKIKQIYIKIILVLFLSTYIINIWLIINKHIKIMNN